MLPDQHKQFYSTMVRIRTFEEIAIDVFRAGKIPGFIHTYVGEEAIAAGVCGALEKGDLITSTHRGHGHCIAKGMQMNRMMAELFGKSTGYNRGKGGSMHIADISSGILGCSGIVGGGISIATGAAWASKYLRTGQVSVAFFGDGATNRGTFHEAINMAAIWSLPVVYVVEDNKWALSVPTSASIPVSDICERAAAYGIPGVSVDGNDVLAVYEVAKNAVQRARSGDGPTLLVCRTARPGGHEEGDAQSYRDRADIEEAKKKDPIPRYRDYLLGSEILTEADLADIERKAAQEAHEAVDFAESSPYPRPEEAMDNLFQEIFK